MQRQPSRRVGDALRPARADRLAERLAAEHGLSLDELLALDADGLIDLLWPDPSGPGASHR